MLPYQVQRKINSFVDNVAMSRVKQFYPSAVAKYAQVPMNVAFDGLLDLVQSGELILKWELRCPNENCVRRLIISNDKDRNFGTILCSYCGMEFDTKPSDYFPVFELNPKFRADLREEKKTQRIPFLQLN